MPRWILLTLLFCSSTVSAQTVILDADFDDKTVGALIGIGGAAVGEPASVSVELLATVRDAPFATPSLEMQDTLDFGARYAHFTFLPGVEITTGIVTMHLDLWFTEMDNYVLNVRERGTTGLNFLALVFQKSGACFIRDSGGLVLTNPDTYATTLPLAVDIVFDMDAGTYDVSFDGVLIVDDETHDVDASRGVATIMLGTGHDFDINGVFYVDNILVTATFATSVSEASMGEVKSLYGTTSR